MISKGDIQIIGSKLTTGGDAVIDAADDLTIASAAESEYSYKMEEEMSLDGLSFSTTRSSASLNLHQKGSRKTEESTDITQQASVLNIGGNFTTRSGKDTTVMGSDILAVGDIDMKADGNMNILSAEETQEIIEKDAELKNTISFTVGNAWAETAYQTADAIDEIGKTDEARDGSAARKTNADLAKAKAALQAMKTAKTIESVARSASTAGTLGFYASVSQTLDVTEQENKTNKTRARGSRIISVGGDVDLEAKKDLSIKGSQVSSYQGDISLSGDDVIIEAAKNTDTTSSGTQSHSETTELFNTSGVVSVPTFSKSDSRANNTKTSYTNSQIGAGNGTIKIKSKKDTTIAGANIKGETVDLTEIGGDLTVKSLQDTETGQSSSESFSVGNRLGYNKSDGNTDKAWVSNQTTIIGTQKVDVKADKFELTGAVIANIKEDGTDGGNLSVEVDELVVRDLKDKDYQYNESYGIGLSGAGKRTDGQAKGSDTNTGQSGHGSTSLSYANSGYDRAQISRATLGQGTVKAKQTVIITDNPNQTGVNRDISMAQSLTKDETLGGYGLDVTIDNQMVTDTGQWAADNLGALAGLPGNAVQAGGRVGTAVGDVAGVGTSVVTGKSSIAEGADVVLNNRLGTLREHKETKAQDEVYANRQNNLLNQDAEGVQQTLETEVNTTTEVLGGSNTNSDGSDKKTYVYNEAGGNMTTPDGGRVNKNQVLGITDEKTGDVGINVNNPGLQDGVEVTRLATHEAAHRSGYGEGMSSLLGDISADVWKNQNTRYERQTGGGKNEIQTQIEWVKKNQNSPVLIAGNKLAGKVKEGEAFGPAIAIPPAEAALLAAGVYTTAVAIKNGDKIGPAVKEGVNQFVEGNRKVYEAIKNSMSKESVETGGTELIAETPGDTTIPGVEGAEQGVTQTETLPVEQETTVLTTPGTEETVGNGTTVEGEDQGVTVLNSIPSNIDETLGRIKKGVIHPHRNDGSTFKNRENKLPSKPDGYYREYVHPTEGDSGPGAQRVVVGKNGEKYYTPDHYDTFIELE